MVQTNKQYETIISSELLRKKVGKIMKRDKRMRAFKRSAAAIAAIFVLSLAALNATPVIAQAAEGVPVLGAVTRVLTFNRFVLVDGGYEADIATPRVEGLLDRELQDQLNKQFKDNAQALIAAFESDVAQLKAEFGDETVHLSVVSDYEVKTDNSNILAIDNYTFTGAGSSSTVHSFYTIDKRTGKMLTLSGLFKPGADYIAPLSAYIKSEMERQNREENGLFWLENDEFFEGFSAIKADQSFYINNESQLVICFDKYEVAAGAQGSPEFIIPAGVMTDIAEYDLIK